MQRKIVLLIVLFFSIFHFFGFSQKDVRSYIYSIRITATNNKQYVQTGFRVQGIKGIVTALHGVANAREITAVNEFGAVYSNLEVIKVDIGKDAALLYSNKMANLPNSGFISENPSHTAAYEELKVLGHPKGIGLTQKSVTAGNPVLRQLQSFIQPGISSSFGTRNSPSPSINVIYIEGNLVPGNSGSPIFNKNYKVLGIVNGGLSGGAAGISWAIPFVDVSFKNTSLVKNELNKLQEIPDIIFAQEDLSSPVTKNDKQYLARYFQIQAVQTFSKSYVFDNSIKDHPFKNVIRSKSKKGLRRAAEAEVISFLQTDEGFQGIKKILMDFIETNTHGQMLIFPPGTSLNDLKESSREEAFEKYALETQYDDRFCKITKLDLESRYSDFEGKYVGEIKEVVLDINFVAPICSKTMYTNVSEEELGSFKENWTDFVIEEMIKN